MTISLSSTISIRAAIASSVRSGRNASELENVGYPTIIARQGEYTEYPKAGAENHIAILRYCAGLTGRHGTDPKGLSGFRAGTGPSPRGSVKSPGRRIL